MKKKALLLGLMASMFIVGCGKTPAPTSSEQAPESSEPEPEQEFVNVFVLSGQSNMEGNTSFKSGSTDLLDNAMKELGYDDSQICYDGIEEVRTSLYCAGYGQLNHNNLDGNTQVNSTNKEQRFQGKFEPTKVGMGLNSNKMGPELGCAYGLRDYASSDKPIYFIKMASGGSGFAQSGTDYNWPVKDADGNFPEINMYSTFCKPFIDNNLKLIEEECAESGYKPVIRGWLWHQGESDSADEKCAVYAKRLGDMVEQFRSDYADYAVDGDGDNIAFVDGMICESSSWNKPQVMNQVKQDFADSNDMNFIVDTHANEEKIAANELKTGNPGGDSMHYNTKSSFRLGMAYANIIIENGLLD
ncbi:MAG: sialate O-acetylesterase [Bacilli bacterium]|nr:sialate O-acetylesterase [Bacilli bacterium]